MKKKVQQYIPMLLFMLIGAAGGIFIGKTIIVLEEQGVAEGKRWLALLAMFLFLYAAAYIQIVVHEAGHLLFGLLTGYGFSSFRIGSFMWIKQDGRLSLKRFSLAGTGGQCLMTPPELHNGDYACALYNLGGVIMNLVVSALAITAAALCKPGVPAVSFCAMLAIVGIGFALTNGIPMQSSNTPNDGYNMIAIRKNADSRKAFWMQMKINEQVAAGIRLKEMPEEWFYMPEEEKMTDALVASMGVFYCNRLMDEKKFDEAYGEMEKLLAMKTAMPGIYRNLLKLDMIYCELIGENRDEKLDSLMTNEVIKLMKAMKKFPSVLRTRYAYELLADEDAEKALTCKREFEKAVKKYPHPKEAAAERELMDYAEELFKIRKMQDN